MASAPALTAASTSVSRETPQILIRVRMLRSGKPVGAAASVGDGMGRIVVRADKVEAVRCHGRGCSAAVVRCHDVGQPSRRAPAAADHGEAAHDVAHMWGERVRSKSNRSMRRAGDASSAHPTAWRPASANDRAEVVPRATPPLPSPCTRSSGRKPATCRLEARRPATENR